MVIHHGTIRKNNTLNKSKFSREWGNEMLYCYIHAWLIKKKLPSFPTRASKDLKGLFSFFLNKSSNGRCWRHPCNSESTQLLWFIPHSLAPHIAGWGGSIPTHTKTPKETNPGPQKTNPPKPMASMYCMVYSPTLIINLRMPNVGNFIIHGSDGKQTKKTVLRFTSPMSTDALDHGSEGFFEDLRQATRLLFYRSETLGSWRTILTYAQKAGRAGYTPTSSVLHGVMILINGRK